MFSYFNSLAELVGHPIILHIPAIFSLVICEAYHICCPPLHAEKFLDRRPHRLTANEQCFGSFPASWISFRRPMNQRNHPECMICTPHLQRLQGAFLMSICESRVPSFRTEKTLQGL